MGSDIHKRPLIMLPMGRHAYNRGDRRWTPTQRQREVLDLLVEGKTNAEIAVRLGITVDGAKWHVGELLSQTGCEYRQALASWWREERGRRSGLSAVAALLRGPPRLAWPAIFVGLLVLAAVLIGPRLGDTGGIAEPARSEERRVGKECRSRWSPYH